MHGCSSGTSVVCGEVTQMMEGINSTLKGYVKLTPHISLGLLSSRVVTKHRVGTALNGLKPCARRRWFFCQGRFLSFCDHTADHYASVDKILQDVDRFGSNSIVAQPEPPRPEPESARGVPLVPLFVSA